MAENKLIVGYWDFQGMGHAIKLLLSYFKVPFEDKQYPYANKDEWFAKAKPALNSKLPNIPYIQDGDFVITESVAVLQYAALKTGNKDLMGKNDLDAIRIAQLASVCRDFAMSFVTLCFNPEYEKVKEETLKTKTVPILEKLSKALGDQDYVIGYLTWADFPLAMLLDVLLRLSPDALASYPNLAKFHDRIWSNEGIQAYRKSEKYPKFFMMDIAFWRGEEKI